MLIICPQCGDTLRKGSWEIFTHCPSCGLQWPVDPDEPQRVKRKIARNAVLWTIIALIPVVGILGGMFGAFWGYLAVKTKRTVLGTIAMIIGIVVGAMGQSVVAWWAVGEWDQNRCQKQLTTLASSLRTYRQQTGHYPPSLADLARLNLPAPAECPGDGGPYFYLAPASSISHPVIHGGPSSAPDDARTLVAAEVLQGHRRVRMCIPADLAVRAVGINQFAGLLAEPQNAAFVKGFWPAWAAATQPATTVTPAPPGPAKARATTAPAASGPATRASPAGPASAPAVEAK